MFLLTVRVRATRIGKTITEQKLLQIFCKLNCHSQPRVAATQQPKAEAPHGMAWVPLSPLSTPASLSTGWPWPETVFTKELVTASWVRAFQTYCWLDKPVFLEIEGGIAGLIKGKEEKQWTRPTWVPACPAAPREAVQGCLHRPWPLGEQGLTWLSAALSPGFAQALADSCLGEAGRRLKALVPEAVSFVWVWVATHTVSQSLFFFTEGQEESLCWIL